MTETLESITKNISNKVMQVSSNDHNSFNNNSGDANKVYNKNGDFINFYIYELQKQLKYLTIKSQIIENAQENKKD